MIAGETFPEFLTHVSQVRRFKMSYLEVLPDGSLKALLSTSKGKRRSGLRLTRDMARLVHADGYRLAAFDSTQHKPKQQWVSVDPSRWREYDDVKQIMGRIERHFFTDSILGFSILSSEEKALLFEFARKKVLVAQILYRTIKEKPDTPSTQALSELADQAVNDLFMKEIICYPGFPLIEISSANVLLDRVASQILEITDRQAQDYVIHRIDTYLTKRRLEVMNLFISANEKIPFELLKPERAAHLLARLYVENISANEIRCFKLIVAAVKRYLAINDGSGLTDEQIRALDSLPIWS